jgi:long-chain fatty acid transport protein
MKRFLSRISFITLAILTTAPSLADDGFGLIGNSLRQKALDGADLADSKDAMSMSFNPAGIIGLERGFQIGVTAVLPERGYNAQGASLVVAPGDVRSGGPIFPSPNGADVQPIDAESASGVVTNGAGGINTSYDAGHIKPPIYSQTPFGPVLVTPSFGGPYGGGFAGMDLQQQFISGVYARKFGNLSIGFAPTIGVQMLNVQGLQLLAPLSQNPSATTDKGYDWAVGVGVRFGAQYSLAPSLRVAVAGSTPVFMTPFSSYAGLVADHGRLDAPAHVMAVLPMT